MSAAANQRGLALVTVLMLIAVLTALLATYFLLTRQELAMTRSLMERNRGFYAAEAGLNLRAREIRRTFQGFNRPAGTSPPAAPGQLPCQGVDVGSGDFACGSYGLGERQAITYVGEAPGNPTSISIPPGEPFAHLTANEYRYELSSVASGPQAKPEALLGMRLKSRVVPLFQFAAFYNKDLEILPGPDMTLDGPVHVNGYLYMGAGSSLTIGGQVTTTEDLYHGRKDPADTGTQCAGGGDVFVRDAGGSPRALPDCGSPMPGRTNVTDTAPWGGKLETQVEPVTVPTPDILDPVPGSLYWDKADLRIVLDLISGTVQLRGPDHSVHPFSGALLACSGGTAVGQSTSLRNHREGKDIKMLEVDVGKVLDCVQQFPGVMDGKSLNDTTEGGLVWHLGVAGPLSGTVNDYGVRVSNGAQLASTDPLAPPVRGLTVVTDQALYIQGDYNAVGKKPAAFLADSLNVLSVDWDDADDSFALSDPPRKAGATSVQAAFLAGTDTSGDADGPAGMGAGDYNGGLENYPRFHEDWSGVPFFYRGSFVSLNEPRHVDGPWSTSGVYVPPIRDWGFDTDFGDAANLPPLSPRFVYLRQEVFERSFEF